jgi:hypothetical protein
MFAINGNETQEMSSFWSLVDGGDIVTWIVTILVAVIVAVFVYCSFHRHQINVSKSQREIARHSILRQLEEDIANIFKSKMARVLSLQTKEIEAREFRSILDNEPPWSYEPDHNAIKVAGWNPPVMCFKDGERYWLVRRITKETEVNQEQYVSSGALQETLLWFRRVARAHRDRVINSDDLADLWRFILPLGFSGRLHYFSKYFQGEQEIQAMVYLVNETLRVCCDRKWKTPIHYFRSYFTQEDLQILTKDEDSRELHRRLVACDI